MRWPSSISKLQRKKNVNLEPLLVYRFRSGMTEPPHLAPVNITTTLETDQNLVPIDIVHRQGLVHTGMWMYVVDSQNSILVMKRGPQLITCPNMWSLVGEHTLGMESPVDTVLRGIQEELGSDIISYISFMKPLTLLPLYYLRDYGPSNGNRIDRQVTWSYWVQLNQSADQIMIHVDEEVAEYRWISIDEFDHWLQHEEDLLRNNRPLQRLCHHTIVSLCRLGMGELRNKKEMEIKRYKM
jgi:isopentenyldiphosphate isomerase